MSSPEESMLHLHGEMQQMVAAVTEHAPDGNRCGPLQITLDGLGQAIDHLNGTTQTARVLYEVGADYGETDVSDEEAAVATVTKEIGDLAEELAGIAGNVRNGVVNCPGKCADGACGLGAIDQQNAFWLDPPPIFVGGKRLEPRN